MGQRGPKPKLPKIAKLEGNPGKREVVDSGIDALGEPFAPEHLTDEARACVEVIKASMPPTVFSALDSYTLSAFATAWSVHKKAALEISNPDFKWVVSSARGGDQPNAWLRILDKQAALLATLGDRLGLNPKARAALHVPAEQPKSRFDGLLGQSASLPSSRH